MASENANQLIYYIKRLPIIGKHLPDSLYANLSMKKVLAVVAAVLKFFKGIFGKIIYIGLLMVLPAFFLEKNPAARYSSFLHAFTMFTLIGSFLSSFLFESVTGTLHLRAADAHERKEIHHINLRCE